MNDDDKRPYMAKIRPDEPDEYTLGLEKRLAAVGNDMSELKARLAAKPPDIETEKMLRERVRKAESENASLSRELVDTRHKLVQWQAEATDTSPRAWANLLCRTLLNGPDRTKSYIRERLREMLENEG